MVEAHAKVGTRLALLRADDTWRVLHGEVTLYPATQPPIRTWRYPRVAFLERYMDSAVVAGLLRAEVQDVDGLKIRAEAPPATGTFQRVPGQSDWRPARTPWPRAQWEFDRSDSSYVGQSGLLLGDGPAFVNYDAAFSAFFLGAPPSNQSGQQPRWRFLRPDRRAWLHRVTIAADAMTIEVKGTAYEGVTAELSTPLSQASRTVGRTGRLRMRLPNGLADSSLLVLRQGDDWLDYRYFQRPGLSRDSDDSVVWHQPEAELNLVVAGGEGQYVEFKQELPAAGESRRKMLRTVAAFASGEGGTLLIGVADDTRVVGLNPAEVDHLMLALGQMIRDSIEPEPSYRLRPSEVDGKSVLVLEVPRSGRWHALNPLKPEFYVRRGASTVPARMHEIFGQAGPNMDFPL